MVVRALRSLRPEAVFPPILLLLLALFGLGLPGGFLLDDSPNLSALSAFGGIRSWDDFWLYVWSGTAGPTGRPLALASFALDDAAWPSDAATFKQNNIYFHLLCGCLLGWLAYRLALCRHGERTSAWIAIGTLLLWTAHPYWIATVLYPVQRMAILATVFALAGLLGYVRGRQFLEEGLAWKGLGLMSVGLVAGTALSTLSKENGALLPALALAMESTYLKAHLRSAENDRRFRLWKLMFLWGPVIGGIVLIVGFWDSRILASYDGRDFTLEERLLTEPRILLMYLAHLVVPGWLPLTLFHDDLIMSRSWREPAAWVPAAFWAAAVLTAAWKRARLPLFSMAVLFFLAGQAMESTVIALEPYFDHRSYLPSTVPVAALVLAIASAPVRGMLKGLGVAGLAAALGFSTAVRAQLWADPLRLALTTAEQQPDSIRAQLEAAHTLFDAGHLEAALDFIERAQRRHPEEAILVTQAIMLRCLTTGQVPEGYVAEAEASLRGKTLRHYVVVSLQTLGAVVSAHPCSGIDSGTMVQLADAMLSNRFSSRGYLAELLFFKAHSLLTQGDIALGERTLRQGIAEDPSYDSYMIAVGTLATHRHYKKALDLLDELSRQIDTIDPQKLASRRILNARKPLQEIERMRALLLDDIRSESNRGPSAS